MWKSNCNWIYQSIKQLLIWCPSLRHTHFFIDQTRKLNEDAVIITILCVYSLRCVYELHNLPREIVLLFINCLDGEKWPESLLVGSFCLNSTYFLNKWGSEIFCCLLSNAYVRTDR